jgi:hypothetical protein
VLIDVELLEDAQSTLKGADLQTDLGAQLVKATGGKVVVRVRHASRAAQPQA